MNNYVKKCPITGVESELVKTLSKDFISRELSKHFDSELPVSVIGIDYSIFRNPDTGFEFSYPMLAGSNEFYEWVLAKDSYYPVSRWEWGKVVEIIKSRKSDDKISLLDIGCGSGEFLETIFEEPGLDPVGLDTSETSVAICTEKGLKAYCSRIEQYSRKDFDYAVAFHCLEHVPDPVLFVREMLNHIKGDGAVFISTPYSPMSFEGVFYDSLNYPPHHLTRWNKKAYIALADVLNCNVEFYLPLADSFKTRVYQSLLLKWFGPNKKVSKVAFLTKLLTCPLEFVKAFACQSTREKINGSVAPNTILVKFWLNPE